MCDKPTRGQILDAMTGSSIDGCDPDWCREILDRADPKDMEVVREVVARVPESEASATLATQKRG